MYSPLYKPSQMLEPCCHRFTAVEGGARLAATAAVQNTLVTECGYFVSTRLLHEEAYCIRGSLSSGYKRSVRICRADNVKPDGYELRILTDLQVAEATEFDEVDDWGDELEAKEVLVCTSKVFRRVLEEEIVTMSQINVLIIDSCHLVYKDENLQYIMKIYKQHAVDNRPRILALTHPLFNSPTKDIDNETTEQTENMAICEKSALTDEVVSTQETTDNAIKVKKKSADDIEDVDVYENLDDFDMYEKLEWRIDDLEKQLCCKMDLAEDIDGCKRISNSVAKPRELIIEYSGNPSKEQLPDDYAHLEDFMKNNVNEILEFLDDHRHDPTEIYGEEMYEEFKSIPDPTVEPKQIFKQFLYILQELGPYAADKAAFTLLVKLEKSKIRVPYERHFLLLRLCTTTLVKIRCYAELMFDKYPDDWDKIRVFSTPKVMRFVEILEQFTPPDQKCELDSEKVEKDGDKVEKDGDKVENDSDKVEKDSEKVENDSEKVKCDSGSGNFKLNASKLMKDIESCDFVSLGNKIEDKLNTFEANLKELDNEGPNEVGANAKEEINCRGRTRVRVRARRAAGPHCPRALCGLVYMRHPLMARIVFALCADLSRCKPSLSYLRSQYCAVEPVAEQKESQRQGKKHEEVLKKFRMHECNLLLTTSALEEGIDLPRCNLVLRWDVPASYRSYGLCRGRGRAVRAAAAVLSEESTSQTTLHNLAVYTELDQIISRKCGCGVQDEPTQEEEAYADTFTPLIKPYMPNESVAACCKCRLTDRHTENCTKNDRNAKRAMPNEEKTNDSAAKSKMESDISDSNSLVDSVNKVVDEKVSSEQKNVRLSETNAYNRKCCDRNACDICTSDKDSDVASVDLGSAIALINRYCAKLPSDTFTRLAPQWWMEKVKLPNSDKDAYICTLRLPLNCPLKYNIVGHPMPTRVLARRMVALQACRILHKSGELDNQLMPIGKENFKAAELEATSAVANDKENDESARPGTTKRRQYYYKRTASAFTDCEPIVDTSDSEIDPPGTKRDKEISRQTNRQTDGKRNMLYAIVSSLYCALPERYNTRGRRLHAPQNATQALGILMARADPTDLHIPAFPVYTRSGEVRVSLEHVANADVKVSPRRGRLVRRFMHFVFTEVLRVRRRGMSLQSEGSTKNNYYIVPTIKTTKEDGSTKIDIDWAFLELIYNHTEDKQLTDVGNPIPWRQNKEVKGENFGGRNEEVKQQSNGNVYEEGRSLDMERVKDLTIEGKGAQDQGVNDVLRNNDERVRTESGEKQKCRGNEGVKNYVSSNAEEGVKECSDKESKDDKGMQDDPRIDDGVKILEVNQNDAVSGSLNNENGLKEHGNEKHMDQVNEGVKEQGDEKKGNEMEVKDGLLENPLLKKGEIFVFDVDKYKEAVVTPWYRNQDQPQFFLVAEICWNLSPDSAFPSEVHDSFRSYYRAKYNVALTQQNQPLLDVDHTSARLNLLTPRYVNRKGVALPVSSERTRRAKRDRLDQKQILVPELCTVHPFAAPLWFATVALPCVLYRINALLIADEIRRSVALEVGLGIPRVDDKTMPGFHWPPLDFGWSLSEVLNADAEKSEKKKEEEKEKDKEKDKELRDVEQEQRSKEAAEDNTKEEPVTFKTINDILQEKEDAESGFEIGTWSNEMASSIPDTPFDDFLDPLPPNLTFCTSASGGVNWCDSIQKNKAEYTSSRVYSVADSDCSYISSDFDTDDSDFDQEGSDEDNDVSGFCSSRTSNNAVGVRIEYKTAHEAEAVDVERKRSTRPAPQRHAGAERRDRAELNELLRTGSPDQQYIEKFKRSVEIHKRDIILNKHLVTKDSPIVDLLPDSPETKDNAAKLTLPIDNKLNEIFPLKPEIDVTNNQISIESIERNKRVLLAELKGSLPGDEIKKLNCFSMIDVDIDSPDYVNEKILNVGFDTNERYVEKVLNASAGQFKPYYSDNKGQSGKEYDFDYQPNLEGHPGPSPSVILQALTMSNANDGINLERLETIGDSFLKFAITAYLYCAHPTVHEGKLSHMRSKQVSNLNLYRLGRAKRLGSRMIASKFEPHDNWLPPCHKPPPGPNICADKAETEEGKGSAAADVTTGCYIPYNLITQHSIPDKSIADCVEALIGAYLLECGPRGALLFMSWLGISVLPQHKIVLPQHVASGFSCDQKSRHPSPKRQRSPSSSAEGSQQSSLSDDDEEATWRNPPVVGARPPYRDHDGNWIQIVYGELKAPPSPLLRYIEDPEGELEQMLSGYDALERTLQYRFRDRSLLLQALSHASHQRNRLTDCYQRLEFLGDAILDYLITRHLYEDPRRHCPGALTDLRSALVNNTIFATLAVRHGFHKYFRHMSPGLNEVLTKYVKIQEENGHSISEEHYLIQEDELEQAEDVEVPKALGDLFESVAGAIFLDSGMSLGAVWQSYVRLMGAELEAFSAAAPKSPVRELLEAEPDTAKFGKPERLADGRRVRVCVEVFGRGTFKGIGRNYRIAKGTAARCALRHLRLHRR